MKGLWKKMAVVATATAVLSSVPCLAADAEGKDAVRLQKGPYWNLSAVEASSTSYKLTGKGNKALSGVNYGLLGIGSNSYELSKDTSLTQGACNTLWGSTTNRDVHLYAAWADAQATSTSASSPSTDISGGSDTNFKVAVDNNPVVSVTLDLAGNDTGAEIAAEMEAEINEALEAASLGARVDVDYTSSLYVITSRLAGARSKVVVTDGATLNIADNLKIGVANAGVEVAGAKGAQLCVSDVAGKQTVGSTAVGSAGYMSCSSTMPSGTAVRQVASADLNCTGPSIGTLREYNVSGDGYGLLPVKKYGTATNAVTGSATIALPVKGIESADDCVVTAVGLGTGPSYIKTAVVTADTITVTVDASQSAGTSTYNYVCW